MHKTASGFIIIVVLLLLFVITLMTMQGVDSVVLHHKMQAENTLALRIFLRAEMGIQQVVLSQEGVTIQLPPSSIQVIQSAKKISQDRCGNQTIDIQSIGVLHDERVVLNSEDIFAKVPSEMGCKPVPLHQCIWFSES